MIGKVKAILGSVRAWLLILGAGSVIAAHFAAGDVVFVLNTLAGLLAAIAGVGTVDRFSQSKPVEPVE